MTATQTRQDEQQDEAVEADRPSWRVVVRGTLLGVGLGGPTLVDLTDEGQASAVEADDENVEQDVPSEKPGWRVVFRGALMGVGFGGPTLDEIRSAAGERPAEVGAER